jgi:hypothetical protein
MYPVPDKYRPIPLRSILILSSRVSLGFRSNLSPSGFPHVNHYVSFAQTQTSGPQIVAKRCFQLFSILEGHLLLLLLTNTFTNIVITG